MDAHLKETQKDSRRVYEGHFLKVQKDTIVLPDGKESTREYIKHPGAVTVLPLFDDGSVLMERQFRYPVGQVMI
jgi:ADP-ribose pyrophosphatase